MIDNYDWERLSGIYPAEFVEKMKGLDGKACWKGYKLAGTQKKGGETVDKCVPIQSKHSENPINQMTPNSLPKEPGEGDEKNPQMNEGVPIRMPRMEVIKKAMNKNGSLAMRAEPNYSESEDFIESNEPNGGMAINQLRVMREKIDIMLGMLYPDDNLEPWMATKLTMSTQNLASVADYLRFGVET
jgi:hypothetical protein